jgi:RimJ/RimL family protein N-acetyltransferase
MANAAAKLPPRVLAVNNELQLIRTAASDGEVYMNMLLQDEPELSYRDLPSANDECAEMHRQMAEGSMLSYWVDRQSSKVGYVGVTHIQHDIPYEDYWTMDYWLLKSAQGHGLMKHAARQLLAYGFENDVFSEVQLHIVATNAPSQSVARAIGAVMVPEQSTAEAETWRVAAYE